MDLRGIVDLLSTAIYSTPQVYLRELIQNGVDAITTRERLDPGFRTAGIVITPAGVDGPELRVRDDGVGLTASEIVDFLATVGASIKRDAAGLPSRGLLGRFGIGLLSALMVADQLTVRTRSARDDTRWEWVGRTDGTYALTERPDADWPVGTTVLLTPRAGDPTLVSPAAVSQLAARYAKYLSVPVSIANARGSTAINEEPTFLSDDPDTLLGHGRDLLGVDPFAAIPLDIPLTGARGVAYVLPHPVPPHATEAHTVLLGGMLVSDTNRDIAPPWTFFARCVVTSTGLTPTASREGLVDDVALTTTRDAIGATLRAWIVAMAEHEPLALAAFVSIHYLGLKALVLHDPELAPLIVRLIPLETSRGLRTVAEIVQDGAEVRYVPTIDQFRQVVALSAAHGTIVNAAYTWDLELLRRLPEVVPGVRVREVSVAELIERLDAVPAHEQTLAARLEARAAAALAGADCVPVVRRASGPDVPSYLLTDPDLLRRSERNRARETGASRWSRVLEVLDDATAERDASGGVRLLLNWSNPLVRRLAEQEDDLAFTRAVTLLHLQAVLASGRPLQPDESRTLTSTLSDLMLLSMGTQ